MLVRVSAGASGEDGSDCSTSLTFRRNMVVSLSPWSTARSSSLGFERQGLERDILSLMCCSLH